MHPRGSRPVEKCGEAGGDPENRRRRTTQYREAGMDAGGRDQGVGARSRFLYRPAWPPCSHLREVAPGVSFLLGQLRVFPSSASFSSEASCTTSSLLLWAPACSFLIELSPVAPAPNSSSALVKTVLSDVFPQGQSLAVVLK